MGLCAPQQYKNSKFSTKLESINKGTGTHFPLAPAQDAPACPRVSVARELTLNLGLVRYPREAVSRSFLLCPGENAPIRVGCVKGDPWQMP